eukprot:TRINITY_DN6458_c0_g1_i1.p1 TRINITY_DN6458_c0_g1~~TRINITY_DN6458_c0_g1_i1.p1  ORF type:complete len:1530 (+),score=223.92 TRINITY_DN6458_c0_g1_i1:222-4592(+)
MDSNNPPDLVSAIDVFAKVTATIAARAGEQWVYKLVVNSFAEGEFEKLHADLLHIAEQLNLIWSNKIFIDDDMDLDYRDLLDFLTQLRSRTDLQGSVLDYMVSQQHSSMTSVELQRRLDQLAQIAETRLQFLDERLAGQQHDLSAARESINALLSAVFEYPAAVNPDIPLPSYKRILPRDREVSFLLRAIRNAGTTSASGSVALCGNHGSGKSSLVALLAVSAETNLQYPNGVFWLNVGDEQASLLILLHEFVRNIAGRFIDFATVHEVRLWLTKHFTGKRALLILDDVSDAGASDALRCMDVAAGGRVLMTTRTRNVAAECGATPITVPRLGWLESCALLVKSAGVQDVAFADFSVLETVFQIVKLMHRLPLALSLSGGAVFNNTPHQTSSWKRILPYLISKPSTPSSTQPPSAGSASDRDEQASVDAAQQLADSDCVKRALTAVFEALSAQGIDGKEARARYADLAVFAMSIPAPRNALYCLWGAVESGARNLVDSVITTLTSRGMLCETTDDRFYLPYELLMFNRAESVNKLSSLHSQIVNGYLKQCGGASQWSNLADDGYAFQRLILHIEAAQRHSSLSTEPLLDIRWLQMKTRTCGVVGLLHDLELGASNEAVSAVLRAVQLSAAIIRNDTEQLRTQIVWRLLQRSLPKRCKPFVAQAMHAEGPAWLCPLTRCPLGVENTLKGTMVICSASDQLRGVCMTRNGKKAIVAVREYLRVYDMAARSVVNRVGLRVPGLRSESNHVVAVSDDCKRALMFFLYKTDGFGLYSGGTSANLSVFDLDENSEQEIGKGANGITAALSGDGTRCFAIGSNTAGGIRLHDLKHILEVPRRIPLSESTSAPSRFPSAATMSHDGRLAFIGYNNGLLQLVDLEDAAIVASWQAHSDTIVCVTLSDNGIVGLSAGTDHVVRAWNVTTGVLLHELAAHSAPVRCMAVSPDGRCAITGADDHTARVWSLTTAEEWYTLHGHADSVVFVMLTADNLAYTASLDGTLKWWSVPPPQQIVRGSLILRAPGVVALCSSQNRAVTAHTDLSLRVWSTESATKLFELRTNVQVESFAVSRDGRAVVSIGHAVQFERKLSDLHLRLQLLAMDIDVPLADIQSYMRERAASGDRFVPQPLVDSQVDVWDMYKGKLYCSLKGHTERVRGAQISHNGSRALTLSDDGLIRVYNVLSGDLIMSLQHADEIHDGIVCSACTEQIVGERLHCSKCSPAVDFCSICASQPIPWHDQAHALSKIAGRLFGTVQAAAMSSDGSTAISLSLSSNSVKIWELDSGVDCQVYDLEHAFSCNAGFVTINERGTIAAASDGTDLLILDPGQTYPLHRLTLNMPISALHISPTGTRVAVNISVPQCVRIFATDTGQEILMSQASSVEDYITGQATGFSRSGMLLTMNSVQLKLLEVDGGIARSWNFQFDLPVTCAAVVATPTPVVVVGDPLGNVHILKLKLETFLGMR